MCILTRFYSRHVVAHGTTRHRAEDGMVVCVMAGDGADDGTLETSLCVGRSDCLCREQGDRQDCNNAVHLILLRRERQAIPSSTIWSRPECVSMAGEGAAPDLWSGRLSRCRVESRGYARVLLLRASIPRGGPVCPNSSELRIDALEWLVRL